MEEATVETLLALLQRQKQSELHQRLKETPELFHDWKKRSEAQWKEELIALQGNAYGFSDIYNHLNPEIECPRKNQRMEISDETPELFRDWKKRSEAQWKEELIAFNIFRSRLQS